MSFPIFKHRQAPEVHAPTLLLLDDRLLKTGEQTWKTPEVVAAVEGIPHWNPVLFKRPGSSSITLFYKEGTPISSWSTLAKISDDNGYTWSQKRELVPGDAGGRGPVKNKCIVLSNGNVLAPASVETPMGDWICFTDLSTDDLATWTRSSAPTLNREELPGEGAIQPSLIENSPAKVSMFTRSSTGFVLRSDSDNYGVTWSGLYKTTLFNNNSGIDALGLDHRWLVVHNNVKNNWGARTPLVISMSEDQGRTWRIVATLEDQAPPENFLRIDAHDTVTPRFLPYSMCPTSKQLTFSLSSSWGIQSNGISEFSYPAIVADGSGGAIVSYTYERVGIKVVHLLSHQLQ